MLSEKRKQKNRGNLGLRLKEARTAEGYTQKALADALGIEYYTMVSQMELGYISIPATLWGPIADVLKMNKSEWVLLCLSEYQPEVYRALFDNRGRMEVGKLLNMLRLGQLEDVLSS